jgi:FMN reductase
LIKNAIDYAEDLRTDARIYFSDRAVGAIVCADGSQAMGSTLATLRAIIHALRGWPTPFSAAVNSALRPFTADGKCADPQVAKQLSFVAQQVVEFARMRRLYQAAHPSLNNGTMVAGSQIRTENAAISQRIG